MYDHTKKVVLGVSLLIALWCIIGELLIYIFMGVNVKAMLGFLLGCTIGVASFIHMSVALENSLDMADEEAAKKNTVRTFIIRAVVIAAVMLAAFFSGYFNLVFVVLGMFGLKAAAYLQPFIEKLFQK
ncbi:MAG: hypothetical protein IJM37_01760 [Lachnospiraceae bacterium]|nr:hypothetical protein [Lachnospiraceae bacterium]